MTISKIKQLKENIDRLMHLEVYPNVLADTIAVKSRTLLKESEALIHKIEEDIWDRLIKNECYEEARQLRPHRELDFSTRAYDLTTDHERSIKKTDTGDIVNWD
jgi:archaellum component FlaC